MPDTSPIYRPRKPQESQYYQCVGDTFERFEQVYDKHFAKQYGFFRSYVKQVIYRYLDCGTLHTLCVFRETFSFTQDIRDQKDSHT